MSGVVVVIPTLGERMEWLRTSVQSVLKQDHRSVTVVLSTPSRADVSELVEEFGVHHHVDDTRGLSAAVNSAVKKFAGDAKVVTWIGDDDVLAPGAVSASVAKFDVDESVVATYGDVRVINAEDKTVGFIACGRPLFAWSLYGRNHIPQPGSFYRATAWNELGGLDSSLPHAMDLDLFWRMRDQGKVVRVGREVASYRWHDGSISSNKASSLDNDRIAAARSRSAPVVRGVLARTRLNGPVDKLSMLLSGNRRRPTPPTLGTGAPYFVTDEAMN